MTAVDLGAAAPRAEGRAIRQVVLAALGFSLIPIFTVIATQRGTPLTIILAGRYAVAALALLPAIGWLRRNPLPKGRLVPLVVIGASGQALVAALSLSALAWIPAATLVFLFYTFPAWVTLISAVRGLEPLDRRRLVALAMSFAGLALLVGWPGTAGVHPIGVGLALAAAVSYAAYVPVMGHLQRGIDASLTTLVIALGAVLIFVVAAMLRSELAWPNHGASWGAIAGLGLISTVIAFRLFFVGLAALGPVRTSIVSTVEPLFAAAFAAILLDQPVTLPIVAGGALILAAVVGLQLGATSRGP